MEFSFENQGNNTYLVYKIDSGDELDSMSLGMLTNNKIPGLAPAFFTQLDNIKYIKYNVSSKIAVKQFFDGAINKKRLVGVFLGIVEAVLSADEYMIDSNNILLDINYMFADVSTCETVLICLPVVNKAGTETDIGMLFKNIVFSAKFDRTENCDYVAKLINYLNSTPAFSPEEFKEILKEIEGNKVQSTNNIINCQKNMMSGEHENKLQPTIVKPLTETNVPQDIRQVQNENVFSTQQKIIKSEMPVQNMSFVPQVEDVDEKKIGLFGLLTHYNKENAQIYKKQKQQKKDTEAVKKQANKRGIQSAAIPPASGESFAIPGQAVPIKQQNTGQELSCIVQMQGNQQPIQQSPIQTQHAMPIEKNIQTQPANFGETTVLNTNIGETTVLSMTANVEKQSAYLIRLKSNEKILIDKPVFRIGKEKSYVDYFIGDNTAISRSHANIILRDGEYFIVDTNSTNHTYVNGRMIQSNVEIRLTNETKIRLSNEDFDFKLC